MTSTPGGAPPTEPLRAEHRELLPHVDKLRALGDAAGGPSGARNELLEQSLEFLQEHLLIHARAEEEVLYPAVAGLLGGPQTTATMSADHREVARLVDALASLRPRLGAAATAEDVRELQRLAYGLHALVSLHFAKEEEVYLPLLDSHLTSERAGELFVAMERAAAAARSGR